MSQKFTEVTLGSFSFVMDIFCTNPARAVEIDDTLHMRLASVYCSLTCEWNLLGNLLVQFAGQDLVLLD